eukprot:1271250-Karenia_brevis.AAC.1
MPSGQVHRTDRRAEQRDTFGSLSLSLAPGEQMAKARQASKDVSETGAVDEWFIDDGQACVTPTLADRWLREVDSALQAMGASRSVGDDCKSTARRLCPEASHQKHTGWDT